MPGSWRAWRGGAVDGRIGFGVYAGAGCTDVVLETDGAADIVLIAAAETIDDTVEAGTIVIVDNALAGLGKTG